jgi:hypothetical protein
MKQHKTTWQRHERHVAAAMGQPHAPATPDSQAQTYMGTTRTGTDAWSIECKSWRRLPARVLDALHQAERTATAGRTAAAVLHQVGDRHDADLVVLRWRDFQALLLGVHVDDQATARRVAAAVQMADATPEERAILTPDL